MTTSDTPKIFYYHQRSFYCELFFFTIFVPVLSLFWFTTLYTYHLHGFVYTPAVRSSLYLTISLIASVGLYSHLRAKMSKRLIVLEEGRLIKKSAKSIKIVALSELTSIRLLSIPFLKGFLLLKTSKNNLVSVPLYLRNCSVLLEQLRNNIILNQSCSVDLTDNQWRKLKRIAYQHDLSHRRQFRTLRPLILITIGVALWGMTVASQYWQIPLFPSLLFGLGGVVFPIGAYIITDYRLTLGTFTTNENSELLLSLFIAIMLYMVSGFLFNSIFL